ncbi:hypothetical protein LZ31DRAFT_631927 [Colletotrichum somersetense]|nr:hypothetical protein LZ31DRAFT_631927 [Colletotrichum somersetense]
MAKLTAGDLNPLVIVAGYHGEPFHGAASASPSWWVTSVVLPYWDEPEEATLTEGIPQAFLEKEYTFTDPTSIPNPFFSYKFRSKITDRLTVVPDAHYTKPIDYETVRSIPSSATESLPQSWNDDRLKKSVTRSLVADANGDTSENDTSRLRTPSSTSTAASSRNSGTTWNIMGVYPDTNSVDGPGAPKPGRSRARPGLTPWKALSNPFTKARQPGDGLAHPETSVDITRPGLYLLRRQRIAQERPAPPRSETALGLDSRQRRPRHHREGPSSAGAWES